MSRLGCNGGSEKWATCTVLYHLVPINPQKNTGNYTISNYYAYQLYLYILITQQKTKSSNKFVDEIDVDDTKQYKTSFQIYRCSSCSELAHLFSLLAALRCIAQSFDVARRRQGEMDDLWMSMLLGSKLGHIGTQNPKLYDSMIYMTRSHQANLSISCESFCPSLEVFYSHGPLQQKFQHVDAEKMIAVRHFRHHLQFSQFHGFSSERQRHLQCFAGPPHGET